MQEDQPEKKTKAIYIVSGDGCNPEPARPKVILLKTARRKTCTQSHTAGFAKAIKRKLGDRNHPGSKSDLLLL